MAPLNLSAKDLVININGSDWSNFVTEAEFAIGDYDVLSGLNLVTGMIKLQVPLGGIGAPASISPYADPLIWGRGVEVAIEVRSGASFVPIEVIGQTLYITKIPQEPYQDSPTSPLIIDVPVGCRLSLENFPDPIIVTDTGIEPAIALLRNEAISNLLAARGLLSDLPEMGYRIEFPIARIQSSETPIQFAGAIAATAGYALRWKSTQVIAEPVENAVAAVPYSFSTTGTIESLQPAGDLSEQPPERLIVEGIYIRITPATDEVITVVEETDSRIDPGTGLTVEEVVKVTTITSDRTKTKTEIEEATYKITGDVTDPATLVLRTREITENFYDGGGKLSNQLTTTESLNFDRLGNLGYDFTDSTQRTQALIFGDAGSVNIIYSYDVKNRVREIKSEKTNFGSNYLPDYYSRLDALDVTVNNPLRLAEVKTQSWAENQKNVWRFEEKVKRFNALLNPDRYPVRTTPGAFELSNDSTLSKRSLGIAGDNAPPSTQYISPAFNTEEIPLKVEITSSLGYPSVTLNTRTRRVTLDHIVSEAQLTFMGNLINKFTKGRASGLAVVAQIDSYFLGSSFKPFSLISVAAPSGTYLLKATAIRFVFTTTKAYVGFLGAQW